MSSSPHAAKLAAYNSVATHGAVAAADAHRLVTMLMDGALERIAMARGCMERNDIAGRAQLINRAVQIIGELQGSLDLKEGGELAARLAQLYDYIVRQLLMASLKSRVELLDEANKLLQDIRSAWVAIPNEARAR